MNVFTSKTTGQWLLVVGITGVLAVLTLLLFFVGLSQNNYSLLRMGSINDTLNAIAGILSAVFASRLHPILRRSLPRLSPALLIGVWIGAIAIAFGSWLIITGRSGVELSSYYYFFGNGLIGIWLWALNRIARQQEVWPQPLTRLGSVASVFMMVGLLGLYGILLGLDRNDYPPLLLMTGMSFLGIGILYPIWCLLLGRKILSNQDTRSVVTQNPIQ